MLPSLLHIVDMRAGADAAEIVERGHHRVLQALLDLVRALAPRVLTHPALPAFVDNLMALLGALDTRVDALEPLVTRFAQFLCVYGAQPHASLLKHADVLKYVWFGRDGALIIAKESISFLSVCRGAGAVSAGRRHASCVSPPHCLRGAVC